MVATKNQGPEIPEAIRIPSDECTVTVGGKEYHVHRGQAVEIVGTRSVGEMKASWAFNRLSVEIDAVKVADDATDKAKDEANAKTMALLEDHYDGLLEWMAKRIVTWDWTGLNGLPLPIPDGTPGPLLALSPEELFYLMRILRGEGTADEKNS